jgi:hypothetical protein
MDMTERNLLLKGSQAGEKLKVTEHSKRALNDHCCADKQARESLS